MKVTSVEPQKKNPKRFNVFLDGKFAFGADEDLIVNFRLLPGKQINPEDLEKLLYEAEIGKLMERMYGLVAIRSRSEKEIRDYLRELSFKRKLKNQEEISKITIEYLIERLKQKGLINDLEFARTWIESRRRSKNKGTIALKSELMQKGINREIIDQVFEEEVVDEEALAEKAIVKKLAGFQKLPPVEFKKKFFEFLLRRGFDYSTVKQVFEKLSKKD